ncbi:PREDICTED: PQ-loop repeat-containing protein 3-like isoform X2 [Amphimedon queenslandica]|uniref:PQ-loop repeat-containing protein 3 n=1 Tax=Amphimedon queenslandica TaxID=400682 RepID=A0AAN0J797_AMPQE|nr:PREDICTED: PQ-loop repeat-containing protein 3-like isoform X2 [Amphimedon queenslandica]|eukprot:XP_019852611.1 PREDICTED: PQ-loop repeat-containing protein 3-like isoform X2 [Amphimedon queenslandica]
MFEDILNGSVIILSFIIKLPQVWTTYTMKRTKGVSLRGYWMELFGYVIMVSYCFHNKYPIKNYLDVLLCSIQLILYKGGKAFSLENKACITCIILFLLSALLHFIPNTVFSILLLSRIPVMSLSKCLHIQALYSSKTSANVSALTWGISAYNCFVRVWTSLYNLNDYIVTASYLTNAVLNSVLLIECLYYRFY